MANRSFSVFLPLLLLVCSALPCFALLATQPLPNNVLVGYWGLNEAGYQGLYEEPSLLDVCTYQPYDIIHITSVNSIFAVDRLPATGFSIHCTKPYPGLPPTSNGVVLRQCTQMAEDIKACQKLGKKIMLTIQNNLAQGSMTSDADGVQAAQNIWDIFLGGSSKYRTFGDAVLDGVEVVALDTQKGYASLVKKLAELIQTDQLRTYYISGGPRCLYPDGFFGPVWQNTPLMEPQHFSYLTIFYLASTCSYRNPDWFWSSMDQWSKWALAYPNIRLLVGLPSDNGYTGAPGDYIPPADLVDKAIVTKIRQYPRFSGITLKDVSSDLNNYVCVGESPSKPVTYGSLLRKLLDENTSTSQVQTVKCQPLPAGAERPAPPKVARQTSSGVITGNSIGNLLILAVLAVLLVLPI